MTTDLRPWSHITGMKPYRYQRPPFGVFGQIMTVGERLVCHLCGRDYLSLGAHVWYAHGLDAASYRAEFHLPAETFLTAPSVRKAVSHATLTNGGAERIAQLGVRFVKGDPRIAKGAQTAVLRNRGRIHSDRSGVRARAQAVVVMHRSGRGDLDAAIEALGRALERDTERSTKRRRERGGA